MSCFFVEGGQVLLADLEIVGIVITLCLAVLAVGGACYLFRKMKG